MPYSAPDEWPREALEDLLARARSGEMEAFGLVVTNYQLPLRLYAARLGLRGQNVDDLTQEAFVRALESLERYDPDRSFLAWLKGITYHLYQQEMDRRQRETKARAGALARYLFSRAAEDDAEKAYHADRLDALRGCIDKLSEPNRRLVLLRFSDRWSLARIARETGTASVGSVSKTIHRIRTALAACVRLHLKAMDA